MKTKPSHLEVKAPGGAPNVIIILIDDLGFGGTSAFGGPIPTPTLDRVAEGGLRYTNLHTTALCSPTRDALKAGRNHHMVAMGFIAEMATGRTSRFSSDPGASSAAVTPSGHAPPLLVRAPGLFAGTTRMIVRLRPEGP